MKHEIVNFGLSARQRLLNIARQKGVQLEYVLLRYALERFLFRLGISKFSQQFILKGATAFAIWMGPFGRVTRDVDLEVYGDSKPETVLMAFREICTLPCPEDGVEFDGASFSTEAIKQEDKYPGIRLMFTATIGGAKVHLKFDIGCGDSVYPTAEQMEYPTLLGGEPPNIRIYPRYTIVAEKLQVMVEKDVLNSRLKDYYDVWLLATHFDFDFDLLKTAISKTFERRGTAIPHNMPNALTETFANDANKQRQWSAFLRKSQLDESSQTLSDIVSVIAMFLTPVLTHDWSGGTWNARQQCWHQEFSIRSYRPSDADVVSEVICRTLQECNANDYSPEFIQENIESHSPEAMAEFAKDAHFYVATANEKVVGCGGITGYWGSTTESYLLSVFVLPEVQGRGIGRRIIETLEADEFFKRAWRTEVGSSLTAVGFYQKMGYAFKNGVATPDEFGVVRLEKRRGG